MSPSPGSSPPIEVDAEADPSAIKPPSTVLALSEPIIRIGAKERTVPDDVSATARAWGGALQVRRTGFTGTLLPIPPFTRKDVPPIGIGAVAIRSSRLPSTRWSLTLG
jgi:hypothetical protein